MYMWVCGWVWVWVCGCVGVWVCTFYAKTCINLIGSVAIIVLRFYVRRSTDGA